VDYSDGSLAATYEYDAYGNVVTQSGTYAAANPLRFSTKYWDGETGFGYWGYRYYSSRPGRWLNRDPAGEDNGPLLQVYAGNASVLFTDALGLCAVDCSDCWRTCISAAGQALGRGEHAWVICRPDGCLCACVNQTRYPPSDDPIAEAKRACALVHEETHVSQRDSWCVYCPCGNGLTRLVYRTICGDWPECEAYQAELDCLGKRLAACPKDDDRCRKGILAAIGSVLADGCADYACMTPLYPPREVIYEFGVDEYNRITWRACGRLAIKGEDWPARPGRDHW
jgi:RHS repeat-associated protein